MKIILCGYNWAGCKALELLINNNYEVFVYTHKNPDHTISLLDYCEKMEVNYSLEKITLDNLPFQPDIICSIYYQYIIDSKVIDKVEGKIFNLHPSILPDYRGCSSLVWAMINGDSKTGFTYHYINPKIDDGNIIYQDIITIEDFDTGLSLYYKAMFKAMEKFLFVLDLVKIGYIGINQKSSSENRYFKRGAPFSGIIDQGWGIEKVERFIRAMNFPPLFPAKIGNIEIKTIRDYKVYYNDKKS